MGFVVDNNEARLMTFFNTARETKQQLTCFCFQFWEPYAYAHEMTYTVSSGTLNSTIPYYAPTPFDLERPTSA